MAKAKDLQSLGLRRVKDQWSKTNGQGPMVKRHLVDRALELLVALAEDLGRRRASVTEGPPQHTHAHATHKTHTHTHTQKAHDTHMEQHTQNAHTHAHTHTHMQHTELSRWERTWTLTRRRVNISQCILTMRCHCDRSHSCQHGAVGIAAEAAGKRCLEDG